MPIVQTSFFLRQTSLALSSYRETGLACFLVVGISLKQNYLVYTNPIQHGVLLLIPKTVLATGLQWKGGGIHSVTSVFFLRSQVYIFCFSNKAIINILAINTFKFCIFFLTAYNNFRLHSSKLSLENSVLAVLVCFLLMSTKIKHTHK